MKTLRLIARGTATLIASVAVLVVVGLGVLMWAGYRPLVVLSGSMVPKLPVGSAAIVKPMPARDVRVGDVITFQNPMDRGERITHRVVRIFHREGKTLYTTKGDANPTSDPWDLMLPGHVGHQVADVPYLGYAMAYAGRPDLRRALIPLATLLLMLSFVRSIWRRDESTPAEAPGSSRRPVRPMRLLAGAAIVAGIAGGVQTTRAAMTDGFQGTADFSTGRVALARDGADLDLDGSRLLPGGSVTGTATLRNDGSLPARMTLAHRALESTAPDGCALRDVARLDVRDRSGDQVAPLGQTGPLALDELAPGATRAYTVTLTFPARGDRTAASTDNCVQGSLLRERFSWTAEEHTP